MINNGFPKTPRARLELQRACENMITSMAQSFFKPTVMDGVLNSALDHRFPHLPYEFVSSTIDAWAKSIIDSPFMFSDSRIDASATDINEAGYAYFYRSVGIFFGGSIKDESVIKKVAADPLAVTLGDLFEMGDTTDAEMITINLLGEEICFFEVFVYFALLESKGIESADTLVDHINVYTMQLIKWIRLQFPSVSH